MINSTLSEDVKEITYHGSVNLGIAVDTPRGLIVPVIKGADDLNIAGIARKIADLAKRTRDNKIGPDELSGGTFTITNTGSVGALFDTPIFVPPQSAILGTGAIVKRPMVIKDADGNEVIAIRSMCYLAMSYDHRNIDGADASRFLAAVKKRIEAGEFEGELACSGLGAAGWPTGHPSAPRRVSTRISVGVAHAHRGRGGERVPRNPTHHRPDRRRSSGHPAGPFRADRAGREPVEPAHRQPGQRRVRRGRRGDQPVRRRGRRPPVDRRTTSTCCCPRG